MFSDSNVMQDHMIKDHYKIQQLSGNGEKNVKCDKCSLQFTSKIALSQQILTTYTPRRIYET